MKYLGIDYGLKRIGIAISDNIGSIAFPREIIENNHQGYKKILEIIHQEKIEAIVIGESVSLDGSVNKVQYNINEFKQKLSGDASIPIFFEKEWMSSAAADSYLYTKGNIAKNRWTERDNDKKKGPNDDRAAAVILQRFLDRK